MRIAGGSLGGRLIAAPADSRIRPTSDKVRQAIFNVLNHRDFGTGFALDRARVIDLFAGTGALGIEAISQGAAYALFVEDDAASRALIRANVEALNLTGVTKIWRRDATDLGPMTAGAGGPFNLAFLDPPYRKGLLARALSSMRDGAWLDRNAIAVAESARDEEFLLPDGYTLLEEKNYGETYVRFLAGHMS